MEYNKDYFYYSNADGKFYNIRLKSIDNLVYKFSVTKLVHNGWRDIPDTLQNEFQIVKQEEQLNTIFDNKDYLIIKVMVMISIYGPYFENKIQKQFYKELEQLFNQYPEQYIKFVDDKFIENINYQFKILNTGI